MSDTDGMDEVLNRLNEAVANWKGDPQAAEITRLRAEVERLGRNLDVERGATQAAVRLHGEVLAENDRLRAALEEAIKFVDQAEMALTPRGEAYVARWRAALDSQPAPSESHLAPDHQAAMHGALRRSVSVVQPAPGKEEA